MSLLSYDSTLIMLTHNAESYCYDIIVKSETNYYETCIKDLG